MKLSESTNWRDGFHQELITFLCTDFAGLARGRSFPKQDLPSKLKSGVGWVPINQTITAFDDIPECPHWGSHGDIRLVGDPDTETRVDLTLGAPPLHLYLCNILELDGTTWDLCTRSFLQRTLDELSNTIGTKVTAAFEHEFAFLTDSGSRQPGFSYRAGRVREPFGTFFMSALEQAGQQPEMFLPEFGCNQFEYTCRPAGALSAADGAVITREIAYDLANQLGEKISYSPRTSTQGVGNGVHIHFSLQAQNGSNALYDTNSDHNLSALGASFAAGIITCLPAILAFTAPSVVSYDRLIPHQWSSAYTCFGDRNREAALRICPVDQFSERTAEEQFHFEYRAADATANPYLALATILLAGLEGVKQKLDAPSMLNTDPSELSESERAALNIKRLPTSLVDALDAMKTSSVVSSWFTPAFLDSYLAVKYSEIDKVKDDDEETLCLRYREIY